MKRDYISFHRIRYCLIFFDILTFHLIKERWVSFLIMKGRSKILLNCQSKDEIGSIEKLTCQIIFISNKKQHIVANVVISSEMSIFAHLNFRKYHFTYWPLFNSIHLWLMLISSIHYMKNDKQIEIFVHNSSGSGCISNLHFDISFKDFFVLSIFNLIII